MDSQDKKKEIRFGLLDLVFLRMDENKLQEELNKVFKDKVEMSSVDNQYLLIDEDYRIDFYCGDIAGSVWYLPTRNEDIFFITEISLD